MSTTPQPTPLAYAARASASTNGSRWRATRWLVSAFSLKGTFHDLNQDSLHWQDGQFWGVADGVGGGAHGEVASRILLDFMASLSRPPESAIQTTLQEADRLIDAQVRSLGQGPGAAVMACLWAQPQSGQWLAALVGDCKILHLQRRARRWQCLWASPEQTYERAGQQPPQGISPNSPANMVGCGMSAPAFTHTLHVRPNERLVMCSDGFAGQLDHPDVAARVDRAGRSLAPTTAQAWCEAARRAGSQDDISVLIIQRQDRLTWRAHLAILSVAAFVVAGACAIAWSLA